MQVANAREDSVEDSSTMLHLVRCKLKWKVLLKNPILPTCICISLIHLVSMLKNQKQLI